jgi:hemolysin activation/secretion protein
MLVLRLLFAFGRGFGVAAIYWLATLAPESAAAQGLPRGPVEPLLQGPEETRPELLPVDPGVPDFSAPGRILPQIRIPKEDGAAAALAGGMISVRSFRFLGNEALSDAELDVVTEPYLGQGRRYSALLEARDRVTRAYVDAGYISSGAVLPVQDYTGGVVDITIIEGKLTAIEVSTDGRLRSQYLTSRLRATGRALNVNTLSESLRRLKRDPRITAVTAELVPGEEPGESVLAVEVDESSPLWSQANFENYATEAIGGLRGRMRAGHRNVSGWGDAWSGTYAAGEGLQDVDLQLDVPVTRWDTSIELRARLAFSEIVEDEITKLFSPKLESEFQEYGITLRQPVLRERGQEARLFVAGEWKRSERLVDGKKLPGAQDQTVLALRLGGDYLVRLRQRAMSARFSVGFGLDGLDATKGTGDDPDSQFTSALIQVQAVEYLPWFAMRLHSRFDTQLTIGHLPGLEQFSLGGHGSVRGYRENLVVRDIGLVASLELRVPLPHFGLMERFELGLFSDAGYARDIDSSGAIAETLVSAGLGLHANIARHCSASLEWARGFTARSLVTGKGLQDDGLHFSLRFRFP